MQALDYLGIIFRWIIPFFKKRFILSRNGFKVRNCFLFIYFWFFYKPKKNWFEIESIFSICTTLRMLDITIIFLSIHIFLAGKINVTWCCHAKTKYFARTLEKLPIDISLTLCKLHENFWRGFKMVAVAALELLSWHIFTMKP